MRSRAVIRGLAAHGWYEVRQTGSHEQFRIGELPEVAPGGPRLGGAVAVPPSPRSIQERLSRTLAARF
ncbi:MAG TPA: type II toxin-antitoxin system HicA family toxin [Allosphingosinicella sp.]|jgi:hypothetical protein